MWNVAALFRLLAAAGSLSVGLVLDGPRMWHHCIPLSTLPQLHFYTQFTSVLKDIQRCTRCWNDLEWMSLIKDVRAVAALEPLLAARTHMSSSLVHAWPLPLCCRHGRRRECVVLSAR